MDTNEINIQDFAKFVENQDEVYTLLERGANDLIELKTCVNCVKGQLTEINGNLAKLKNVSPIQIDVSTGEESYNKLESFMKEYTGKASNIVARSEVAKELIQAYNEGKDISNGDDILKTLTDLGVFWVAKAATEGKTGLSALGCLFAYETDAMYDDSIFVVGDGIGKVAATIKDPALTQLIEIDSNLTAGTLAVALYSTIINADRISKEGDWDPVKDRDRLFFEVLADSVGYLSWTVAASAIAAEIGETAGGPIGAAAATAIAWVTTSSIDIVKDEVTGDKVIHTIIRGDDEYPVPRNGSGETGTYDVILRNYTENNPKRTIQGKEYSDTNYKSIMYENWEDVYSNARSMYGDTKVDNFNKSLEILKSIEDPEDAQKYMAQIREDFSYTPSRTNEMSGFYNQLSNFDFDLNEYYNYYHPNTEQGSE